MTTGSSLGLSVMFLPIRSRRLWACPSTPSLLSGVSESSAGTSGVGSGAGRSVIAVIGAATSMLRAPAIMKQIISSGRMTIIVFLPISNKRTRANQCRAVMSGARFAARRIGSAQLIGERGTARMWADNVAAREAVLPAVDCRDAWYARDSCREHISNLEGEYDDS